MISTSTSTAKPCGECPRCGGTLYEYLVHHCTTAVKILFRWEVVA